MMNLRTVNFETLNGSRVLLRLDLDVSIENGEVVGDPLRLLSGLETFKSLQNVGAKTVAIGHLGRPEGVDLKLSLEPVAEWFKGKLDNESVRFQEMIRFDKLLANVNSMAPGDILVLENLRFAPEEKANDVEFSKHLAQLGDVYINDAFANSHREHASMVGVTGHIESYAGPRVMKELEALEPILDGEKDSFVAVIGGAKISSKLHALIRLLEKCSAVFVGGAIATAFYAAKGLDVGSSFYRTEDIELADGLILKPALRLPVDVVVRNKEGEYRSCLPTEIKPNEAIVDIGKRSVENIQAHVRNAKLILWNGPVGIVEERESRVATDAIAQILAEVSRGSAYGVAGGGNTIAIPKELGLLDLFDHVSLGGGAMLEYVGGQSLPAFEVLKEG